VNPALRSGVFAFLLSRLLILFILVLTANLLFEPPVRGPVGDVHNSNISLRRLSVTEVLRRVTVGADSLWIINIASDGYEKEPFNTTVQHKWAFFPLYPLLLRFCARLTGEFPLTGIGLSNCFLFCALVLVYQTARAFGCDPEEANRTVFYLAVFPVSYFFSLAQTESLFLLLTVSCVYAAKRERWWLAGILGGFASATRFAGVFLAVPVGVLYWQASRANAVGTSAGAKGFSQKLKTDVIALLLVPSGLLAFMIYLKHITGDAFAFAHIQVAWGHTAGFFWRPLLTYLRDPLQVSAGWDFRLLNFAATITALVCSIVLMKRREWALGFFSLVSIVVPLSYQPLLQSLARYVMVIFPVYIVLARAGSSTRIDQVIQAIFVGLLCLMSAMLAGSVTLAFA
jgi:Gpi18-like mannosyltransferase